ncbi:hypothetical protein JOF53_001440 [Crossiella equi]|uniref:Zinc-finger n=1 Tax=Crossiella equi TaxID=130796 RepID=A0ABS5A7J9_9PSEU|nr:zinc finger protein [Crossiella equi]MBP2472568.1 hypothetical protein [Crossiella equi]
MTTAPEHRPFSFGLPASQPLVFYWMPVDGSRHAVIGPHGSHRPGEHAETLCGRPVVARTASEGEWIRWSTCDDCWQAAKDVRA